MRRILLLDKEKKTICLSLTQGWGGRGSQENLCFPKAPDSKPSRERPLPSFLETFRLLNQNFKLEQSFVGVLHFIAVGAHQSFLLHFHIPPPSSGAPCSAPNLDKEEDSSHPFELSRDGSPFPLRCCPSLPHSHTDFLAHSTAAKNHQGVVGNHQLSPHRFFLPTRDSPTALKASGCIISD